MHSGMLWFDNSTNDVSEKIQKALDYYVKKYGRQPDMCLLNPVTLNGASPQIDGLTIRPYHAVLPGHIWIGIESKD